MASHSYIQNGGATAHASSYDIKSVREFPKALEPLYAVSRWVQWGWRLAPRGKMQKPPLNRYGSPAAYNDPDNLRSFAEVWSDLNRSPNGLNDTIELRTDGVGFAPTDELPIQFIDIDDCRNPE